MKRLLLVGTLMMSSASPSQDILQIPPAAADVRIAYGTDSFQFGDLRLPNGLDHWPVVVVIHGGFWRSAYNLDHVSHLSDKLRQSGMATWSLEYRRIGDSGGGWPGTFLDVAAGIDHLREFAPRYHLDLSRVVVVGHSAGGHLALWAAARSRVRSGSEIGSTNALPLKGVVSLAGVTDLERGWALGLSRGIVKELLGGTPAEVPDRYGAGSPLRLLPLGVPQVLIHGTADRNVPYELSERFVEASVQKGDRARLITLDGAGHFEVIDPRTRQWAVVEQAIAELLRN